MGFRDGDGAWDEVAAITPVTRRRIAGVTPLRRADVSKSTEVSALTANFSIRPSSQFLNTTAADHQRRTQLHAALSILCPGPFQDPVEPPSNAAKLKPRELEGAWLLCTEA